MFNFFKRRKPANHGKGAFAIFRFDRDFLPEDEYDRAVRCGVKHGILYPVDTVELAEFYSQLYITVEGIQHTFDSVIFDLVDKAGNRISVADVPALLTAK